ncbi:MAG TPA: TetR/AcrR family transcriptional regulator [Candidatus Dormibacteraeota bacterium]|nr:TetR/AcrR family transcriptional regulator [Candidatus Dormibacteraeota bacterium]
MSPRRYQMANRSVAVRATRSRIVKAAVRLHARKGALRTTWDDIAVEASVSRATVYHHFPSLDELVPACAQVAFDLIDVPSPEEAAARFAALRTPHDRLAQFTRETCRCYAAGAPWLRAAWRERDVVPAMGAAVHRLQRALRVLLDAALEGASIDRRRHPVLVTLLDFPFWDSLDAAAVPRGRIPHEIQRLAETVIRNAR